MIEDKKPGRQTLVPGEKSSRMTFTINESARDAFIEFQHAGGFPSKSAAFRALVEQTKGTTDGRRPDSVSS